MLFHGVTLALADLQDGFFKSMISDIHRSLLNNQKGQCFSALNINIMFQQSVDSFNCSEFEYARYLHIYTFCTIGVTWSTVTQIATYSVEWLKTQIKFMELKTKEQNVNAEKN